MIIPLTGCTAIQHHMANQHVRRGQARLAANDLEAALAEFQSAAQINPQLAVAHSRMGVIYKRMGEYTKAIESFVEAIRREPFSFEDSLDLAQVYQFLGQITEAIGAYLHAVAIDPDHFDAQLNLGVCYQETGDPKQAEERFRQAIEIAPQQPYAYANLGVALDAQEKYYEAIRAYKEALEREGFQPVLLVNLAQTYMKQDRLKMARLTLNETIRLDPDLAAAHETLGYCLFRMREFDAAETSYQQAIEIDWRLPRSHAGLASIGMLRFLEDEAQIEERDQALEHWHQSLEIDPMQPQIRNLIARFSKQVDNPNEALWVGRSGS